MSLAFSRAIMRVKRGGSYRPSVWIWRVSARAEVMRRKVFDRGADTDGKPGMIGSIVLWPLSGQKRARKLASLRCILGVIPTVVACGRPVHSRDILP